MYKRAGETPLACLARFKESHPAYADTPMTYLGRLDPLAEGVLLLAPGSIPQEVRDDMLAFPKEYVAGVLIGFSTDTYDILGRITHEADAKSLRMIHAPQIMGAVAGLVGKRTQAYPPYSSKPVAGKPLFQWAREGKIDHIEIPTHEIEVYSAILERISHISAPKLLARIEGSVQCVEGDFRQEEIRADWQRTLGPRYQESFPVLTIRFTVSSGTYIRALAHELGSVLSAHGCLLSLVRTAVGEHTSDASIR